MVSAKNKRRRRSDIIRVIHNEKTDNTQIPTENTCFAASGFRIALTKFANLLQQNLDLLLLTYVISAILLVVLN